jgi:adenylate cyclase class IV
MTYKENTNKEFQNENEVIINDFEQGVNIFLGLGCKKNIILKK